MSPSPSNLQEHRRQHHGDASRQRVLVTGASGFIGSAIVEALLSRGHSVVACTHQHDICAQADGLSRVEVDYMHDLEADAWLPRLAGVDAVINAVGILRERAGASFDALHHRAPAALFQACEQAGVRRCIQISALGANTQATSRYHRTKQAGDDALRASHLDWTVVQPSLVFGPGGDSSRLFALLASLPVTPLVGTGAQQVQPLHVDDLCALMMHLLEQRLAVGETIAAVGNRPLSLRELLADLRKGMGLRPALPMPVPVWAIRIAARFGDLTGRGALSTETLAMLQRGNTADGTTTRDLLGHPPRDPATFIQGHQATGWRLTAVTEWVKPLLLVSLAIMWLSAGIVSWRYARHEGLQLLAMLGLPDAFVAPAFAAACAINLTLGVLTLTAPGPRLWLAQFVVMGSYTGALTVVAPQLWLDPFGPLVKNLPVAAMLCWLAYTAEAG